jgi:hypothetical protein
VVGAPSHRIGNGAEAVHEAGLIVAYDISEGSQAAPVFTIQGEAQYARLGRCEQHLPTCTNTHRERERETKVQIRTQAHTRRVRDRESRYDGAVLPADCGCVSAIAWL